MGYCLEALVVIDSSPKILILPFVMKTIEEMLCNKARGVPRMANPRCERRDQDCHDYNHDEHCENEDDDRRSK